jgi:Tfp pilus assembly protein PilV
MDDHLPTDPHQRSRLAGEDGVTLVEVLVSMMLVGLIALSFTGFDVVQRTSADQRRNAQATQIAQADQERLRGMSADQLATLNQTRNVTMDNTVFTVTSTGKYQSAGTGSDSCASADSAADYAKVTSTVNWTANQRSPVSETSLITPRVGGSLIVQVQDQGAAGLPGVVVKATGTDADTSGVVRGGTTDSTGCVIFGSLPIGTYSVVTSLSGYVDKSGSSTPTSQITTTPGNTTNLTVRLAQPGKIQATAFVGVYNTSSTVATRAPAVSWNNSQMATASVYDPATNENAAPMPLTAASAFPFIVGTTGTNFTGNYAIYAGNCSSDLPTNAADQSLATVSPGGTATSTANGQAYFKLGASTVTGVKVPVLNVSVTYGGSAIKPDHIKLTDACNDNWSATIASGSTKPTLGWLAYPGQPFSSSYTVCADYQYNGFSYRKGTATVANTSFIGSKGNAVTVDISDSWWGATSGTC